MATALTRGVPLTLMNHPAGRHGFDTLDDVPRSREIVRATLEFLTTHLLGEAAVTAGGRAST